MALERLEINSLINDVLTPSNLLNTETSITFWLDSSAFEKNANLFFIEGSNFVLHASIEKDGVLLTRNGSNCYGKIKKPLPVGGQVFCVLSWSSNLLRVVLLGPDFGALSAEEKETRFSEFKVEITTAPTLPPHSLLLWAQKQAYLPKVNYTSPKELQGTIKHSFEAILKTFRETGMITHFWDEKDGKIRPKKETDIHDFIYSQLYSIALVKNLQIYKEPEVAGGKIEFIISGAMTNSKIINICVEVKKAHSPDLEHGLIVQLPDYMRSKGCDNGIYLVLLFKCDKFDEPTRSGAQIEWDLYELLREKGLSNFIDLIIWPVSIQSPPSKR